MWLWREIDPETGGWLFKGEIVESDFMEEGMPPIQLDNPCYLDVVAEITKFSHAEILEANGKWIDDKLYGKIWIANETGTTT